MTPPPPLSHHTPEKSDKWMDCIQFIFSETFFANGRENCLRSIRIDVDERKFTYRFNRTFSVTDRQNSEGSFRQEAIGHEVNTDEERNLQYWFVILKHNNAGQLNDLLAASHFVAGSLLKCSMTIHCISSISPWLSYGLVLGLPFEYPSFGSLSHYDVYRMCSLKCFWCFLVFWQDSGSVCYVREGGGKFQRQQKPVVFWTYSCS